MPHLLWPGRDDGVLLLGHFDTVWPAGTLVDWPFAVEAGVARGPGVFDMKAGIVQMLAAVSTLADPGAVTVLLTGDEEVGSPTSRAVIEREALRAQAVLVCEPSADGAAVKIARKGIADYELRVRGRAAHAGLEPELGVNATVEIAHQILAAQALADPEQGTSVTPTIVTGGTTTNSVPESAFVRLDVRSWTRAELDRADAGLRALTARLPGAEVSVMGGVNRYPFEREVAMELMRAAHDVSRSLGVDPVEAVRSGGASDGNFTAALGVPTLDGLGAVGAHPHSRSEWVDTTAMPHQAAVLAGLIERIITNGLPESSA
ncbi:M20/M25/M40 family metallo-hydrolase [Kineosporia sp. NBRC 101731]|uniref:M20/M25/M40 family metallo-hydrolase n=1 Tax=Kineosporia sp. NBRC 101731 TaxID=3032199 RepID=UPI002554507A|nr:M20/M25/M40 family metallo-hydrolase [Kineosporia sp. NBRC 101731]